MATAQRDIALGLQFELFEFAKSKNASMFLNWNADGLTSKSVKFDFDSAFRQAIENAKTIHFNLNGIQDLSNALKAGSEGCNLGNFTNWEFFILVSLGETRKEIAEKLRFYKGGLTMPLEAVAASIAKG